LALIAFAGHSLWVRFESRSIQDMASQVDLDKRLVFSSTPLIATGEMALVCNECIARHQKIQPIAEGGLAFASSPPTWLARAWCHTALGEWSQAIPFVEKHLDYFGFRDDVAGDLGLLRQLAAPQEAEVWYLDQLSVHPQSVRLLEDFTRWLERQGKASTMIVFCREHRDRVAPGGPIDLFLMRRLSLATAQTGELDESVVWFERTLNIEPNNPAAWLRLAEVHLQRGALDSVVASARKARALVSDDPRLLTQVMRMLDAGGAIEEAAALRQQLREGSAGQP
jgi:tetratricopeptide (TPR) repeat protein